MQKAAALRKERSIKRAAKSVEAAAAALGGKEAALRQQQQALDAEAELMLTAKEACALVLCTPVVSGCDWRRRPLASMHTLRSLAHTHLLASDHTILSLSLVAPAHLRRCAKRRR